MATFKYAETYCDDYKLLYKLRGTKIKSFDGKVKNTVVWTDLQTGVITLRAGEKTTLVGLLLDYEVPEEVFEA